MKSKKKHLVQRMDRSVMELLKLTKTVVESVIRKEITKNTYKLFQSFDRITSTGT